MVRYHETIAHDNRKISPREEKFSDNSMSSVNEQLGKKSFEIKCSVMKLDFIYLNMSFHIDRLAYSVDLDLSYITIIITRCNSTSYSIVISLISSSLGISTFE